MNVVVWRRCGVAAAALAVAWAGVVHAQKEGAAIGGLPGAIWADNNHDGYVDGYIYNGKFYAGTPPGYDSASRSVLARSSTGERLPTNSSAPTLAAPTRAVALDPVSGLPIPLYPWEEYVPYTNGCGSIGLRDDAPPGGFKPKYRWSAACRYGLAAGPGFESDGKSMWRHKYHLGLEPRLDPNFASLPSALGNGVGEQILAKPKLEAVSNDENVWDWNTGDRQFVVAAHRKAGKGRVDTAKLMIRRVGCPRGQRTNALAQSALASLEIMTGVTLSADQLKALNYKCVELNEMDLIGGFNFYMVYVTHYSGALYANGSVGPNDLVGKNTVTNFALCPDPTAANSCSSLLPPLFAPYLKRKEEIDQIMRSATADREKRFAPLRAALRAKIAAFVAAPNPKTDTPVAKPATRSVSAKKAKGKS